MTPARRYVVIARLPPDLPLALMDAVIGLVYLLSDPRRSSAAAFRVARSLMPMWTWGLYFLAVGLALVLIVVAAWLRVDVPSLLILSTRALSAALFAMWAIMFAMSAVIDVHAALGGVPIYLYLAYRHSFAPAGR